MTLEDIKTELFKREHDAFVKYMNTKEECGEKHEFTQRHYARFCTLYDLVEDLGLRSEYNEFWERMEEGK